MILDFLFQKLIEDNPPEVKMSKCLYSLEKGIECNLCKDSCPENAISFNDNDKSIRFDDKFCSNCGICKTMCPTYAINVKGIGEREILINSGEKKNLVFSCSMDSADGNLKISCLNAFHPELIVAIFLLNKDKKLYFNISSCLNCENGYENSIFNNSLNKAINFTESIGLKLEYEIITEEKNISHLTVEEISRRNLFKLVKNESSNIFIKTINTIIDDEEQISIRKILLKSLNNINFNFEEEKKYPDIFWEYKDVTIDCDGCGKCESTCPNKAWKIEKTDSRIGIYHNFSNCLKCGVCNLACHKNAIKNSITNRDDEQLLKYNLKKEIILKHCKVCNKSFISSNAGDEDEICTVCKKIAILRKKIAASVSIEN